MYYLITAGQKAQIEPYLTDVQKSKLFREKNGNDYVDDEYWPNFIAECGQILNLIAEKEFSQTWEDWTNGLAQFDFGTIEGAATDGFATYREMVARINGSGGLVNDQTKLDTEMAIYIGYTGPILDMVIPITMIRNMLKDGFFEWALRASVHYKDPRAVGIDASVEADNIASIRDVAKKYGRDDAILDYAQLSPKGSLVV